MMNITQDFAPPFKLIAPYFIIGVIFYLISSILTLSINPSELSIHSPDLLSWTHMFLLGFVMMIIFGAMAQLIPVTLEVGHFSVEFYYIIYPLLLVGTIFMALGFSLNSSLLPYGGILVLLSMFIFITEIFLTMKKVSNFSNVTKSILVSNLFLLVGVIIGIIMALTYAGQLNTNIEELLKAHVFSVVFGYIFITIMALSLVLLPMFGLSHNFSQKPLNNAVILMTISVVLVIFSSLFSISIIDKIAYLLSIISLIIYFYQVYLIYKTRARKENDIYIISLFFSFACFLISIILGFLYIFTNYEPLLFTAAWLLFSGFIAYVIIGHLYKIVPFLVWFEKFSPLVGKQKVPMLADMVPVKDANYQFVFGAVGVVISALGLLFMSDEVFKAGASFICIASIFLLKNLLFMIRFK
ncbi:hypothetical protein [Poseidonibacter ostreae]|uniref:Cytochrome C oxidase subunit I n=1 Tax=Poseidonibacter ostreae TaxID=2654171 RepID=A0A6L4WRF1_9BACT|nr:hypothetical protein [Poseidonibacter ostreae]KAB7884868.1 hypothetical protein GBG19_15155 [Poseidonibacter ostreae]KAB7893037.1 hypothetical protein GBG18_00775 [Poseidonibacter ostreae]